MKEALAEDEGQPGWHRNAAGLAGCDPERTGATATGVVGFACPGTAEQEQMPGPPGAVTAALGVCLLSEKHVSTLLESLLFWFVSYRQANRIL